MKVFLEHSRIVPFSEEVGVLVCKLSITSELSLHGSVLGILGQPRSFPPGTSSYTRGSDTTCEAAHGKSA